jgi:hypothetical protein
VCFVALPSPLVVRWRSTFSVRGLRVKWECHFQRPDGMHKKPIRKSERSGTTLPTYSRAKELAPDIRYQQPSAAAVVEKFSVACCDPVPTLDRSGA